MGFEVWYKVKEKLELILYPNQYSRDHKDFVCNTKLLGRIASKTTLFRSKTTLFTSK